MKTGTDRSGRDHPDRGRRHRLGDRDQQPASGAGAAGQREVGPGAERLPAPRRPDPEPGWQTVKGFATQERTVLEGSRWTKARASVAGIKATPELINDPAAFQKFQQAQAELGGALSRLLVTVERYPELKSTRTSSHSRASSRAPRTASRSSACATARRCATTTRASGCSRGAWWPRCVASRRRPTSRPLPAPRRLPRVKFLGGAPGGGIVLRRLAPALLLLAALAAPGAAALRIPPPPDHRVNDYAGALAPADRDRLEQALIARAAKSRNQVVVAIFRSLEGESLEDYSIRLAKAWRIGQKGLDNGSHLPGLPRRSEDAHRGGLRARGQPDRRRLVLHSSRRRRARFRAGQVADGIGRGSTRSTARSQGRTSVRPARIGGSRPMASAGGKGSGCSSSAS